MTERDIARENVFFKSVQDRDLMGIGRVSRAVQDRTPEGRVPASMNQIVSLNRMSRYPNSNDWSSERFHIHIEDMVYFLNISNAPMNSNSECLIPNLEDYINNSYSTTLEGLICERPALTLPNKFIIIKIRTKFYDTPIPTSRIMLLGYDQSNHLTSFLRFLLSNGLVQMPFNTEFFIDYNTAMVDVFPEGSIARESDIIFEQDGHKFTHSFVNDLRDNLISGYHCGSRHNKSSTETVKENDLDRWRFGFECEKEDIIALYDVRNNISKIFDKGFALESDASLCSRSGFELISPVYKLFGTRWEEALHSKEISTLVNSRYSTNCGGHITISNRQMSSSMLVDSLDNWIPLLYSLYPRRRINRYSGFAKSDTFKSGFRGALHCKEYAGQDLLEFRIFPAIKNTKNLHWRVSLIKIMVNNLNISVSDVVANMLDNKSILHRHLRKVYSSKTIKYKAKLYIYYARAVAKNMTKFKEEFIKCDKMFKGGLDLSRLNIRDTDDTYDYDNNELITFTNRPTTLHEVRGSNGQADDEYRLLQDVSSLINENSFEPNPCHFNEEDDWFEEDGDREVSSGISEHVYFNSGNLRRDPSSSTTSITAEEYLRSMDSSRSDVSRDNDTSDFPMQNISINNTSTFLMQNEGESSGDYLRRLLADTDFPL